MRDRGNRTMVFVCVLMVLAAALASGCGAPAAAGPAGYNVRLSLDPAYAKALGDDHVFVHVIPLTARNHWALAGMPVDDYWQSDAAAPAAQRVGREKGTRAFDLSAAAPTALLSADDPAWAAWQRDGTAELMALSSRPAPPRGPADAAAGGPDPRRRLLPAQATADGPRDVSVVVTARGIEVGNGRPGRE